MLWRCPACNRQTDEPVCGRCQTPMSEGEPSAATGLMKETAGSPVFLIAVICFTAAVLFTTIFSWISAGDTMDVNDVKSVVTAFSEKTGAALNPHALKAVSTLYDVATEETETEPQGSLPLDNIFVTVGLWLMVAQGYTSRVNFRKGGPIVLKIAAVIGIVVACVVLVFGALLGAGLWFGRAALVTDLSAETADGIMTSIKDLLACDATMWLLLGLCGFFLLVGLVYLLFFASVTRVLNSILHTAKTGDFGKRAGGLAAVFLGVAALFLFADGALSFAIADLGGIGSLLYGVSFLLFSVTLFTYRRRAHRLLWEQPAFTGETATSMPDVLAGLNAADLMNEPTAQMPIVPPAAPTSAASPRAAEPFSEESMEPQPATGNGNCPSCGTPIPDNTFFCLHCGHKF